ncbi:MAG: hypothetical protein P1V20_30165 [Verrucomicrobiales bacterium]|nr:hypothetical protein [Verrucomicrobiales bacterium]
MRTIHHICFLILSLSIQPICHAADEITWSTTPDDLLSKADISLPAEPKAWERLVDGSLQINAGVLPWKEHREKGENSHSYTLPVDGDFSGPYRLEFDVEMVARNETLKIHFPLGGRSGILRINVSPRGNASSILNAPQTRKYEGLIANEGDRRTYTITVIPQDQNRNYSVDVQVDGEKFLNWSGFVNTTWSKELNQLQLTAWPNSLWRFHRISLFKPGTGQPVLTSNQEAAMEENEEPPEILRGRVERFKEVISNRALRPFRRNVAALANNYGKAIDREITNATNAGNIGLVIALQEEKKSLKNIISAIAVATPDNLPKLPNLPGNANRAHQRIRNTWETIIDKHRTGYTSTVNSLTQKFAESVETFEKELTIARKFDEAKSVRAYRLKHLTIETIIHDPDDDPDDEPENEPTEIVLAGQYQPVPRENVFPMPMPKRPTEPCRVVAWRIDGEPVNQTEFTKMFYGVPDVLGEVVDMDMGEAMSRTWQLRMLGLTAEGKVRTSFTASQPQADHISGAIQLAGRNDVGIALMPDGTCRYFSLNQNPLSNGGWKGDLNRVASWKNVVSVDAGERHVLGMTADGTPLAAGDNSNQNACQIPAQYNRRTCRLVAIGAATRVFALGSGGSEIEVFDPRQNKVIEEVNRTNRFFGWRPREVDSGGKNLDMNSFDGLEDGLIGARPSDVTYANAVGGSHSGERIWFATIREGVQDWRFWGDLGKLCSIDQNHCRERAENCRKIYLNPPYIIGLKPVAFISDEDWTGKATGPGKVTAVDVTPAPLYRNALPLPAPARPKVKGTIEVFRRDGKPLDPKHWEIALLPKDFGNEVVDIQISASDDYYSGIVLFDNGTVNAWSKFDTSLDWSHLQNIVQIQTGREKLMVLDASGDATIWTKEGIRKGRFNPENEPIRKIALRNWDPYILTAGGNVYPALPYGYANWMAKDLPPVIDITADFVPFALGIDGKWRSWNNQSNGRTAAVFDSGYPLGQPLAAGGSLWWIDRDQMLNRANRTGVKMDNGQFKGKRIESITGGQHGFTFVKNVVDRWEIHGGPEDERKYIEPKIQKSIKVTATKYHIFCLKPWGG